MAESGNLFANALAKGLMDKKSTGRLKIKQSWKSVYVVLSNIGLLYFDSVTEAPKDFMPIVSST